MVFDIFGALVAITVHHTTVPLLPQEAYENPPADEVVLPVTLKYASGWYKNDLDDCVFSGIRAYFVRDWEVEENNRGNITVIPPEPDKIAGLVTLVNKKECPGKAAEAVFIYDVMPIIPWRDIKKGKMNPGLPLKMTDITGAPSDQLPRWYSQVLAKAELAVKNNPAIQSFLDDQARSKQSTETTSAEPEPPIPASADASPAQK